MAIAGVTPSGMVVVLLPQGLLTLAVFSKQGVEPDTSPESYRQLKPPQMPLRYFAWARVYWTWVVWLYFSSWSMRNGAPGAPGLAPAPATWGGKKRAATEDMTVKALKPR